MRQILPKGGRYPDLERLGCQVSPRYQLRTGLGGGEPESSESMSTES
jgi:hypothetical protein